MSYFFAYNSRKQLPPGLQERLTELIGMDNWDFCTKLQPGGAMLYQIKNLTSKPEYSTDYPSIASWYLQQMPGCCGVCVSFNSSIDSWFSKKGLGTELMRFKKYIATTAGFTVLFLTDIIYEFNGPQPQNKIITKAGFEEIDNFRNRRTGNKVGLYAVDLVDYNAGYLPVEDINWKKYVAKPVSQSLSNLTPGESNVDTLVGV